MRRGDVAIELRLAPIDSERRRFCITHRGRPVVDAPMGQEEARRRALSFGRVFGLPVVEIALNGERTTLFRPTAGPGSPGAGPVNELSVPCLVR
jgi:hypothetical protein